MTGKAGGVTGSDGGAGRVGGAGGVGKPDTDGGVSVDALATVKSLPTELVATEVAAAPLLMTVPPLLIEEPPPLAPVDSPVLEPPVTIMAALPAVVSA